MLNSDGSEITSVVNVADITFKDLLDNYIYKSNDLSRRTTIFTLENFLEIVRFYGIKVVLEIKGTNWTSTMIDSLIETMQYYVPNKWVALSLEYYLDLISTKIDNIELWYGFNVVGTINTITKQPRTDIRNVTALQYQLVTEAIESEISKAGLILNVWNPFNGDVTKIKNSTIRTITVDQIPPDIESSTCVHSFLSMENNWKGCYSTGEMIERTMHLNKGEFIRIEVPHDQPIIIGIAKWGLLKKGSITITSNTLLPTITDTAEGIVPLYSQNFYKDPYNRVWINVEAIEDGVLIYNFDYSVFRF